MILPGYEPKGLTTAMFSRRKGNQAELDQGMDEMLRAQQRVEAEVATGSEKPIGRCERFGNCGSQNPPNHPRRKRVWEERKGLEVSYLTLCLPFWTGNLSSDTCNAS